MFYDRFKALCDQRGVSVTRATLDMGLSRSIGTKWKKTGATPNTETLKTISEYFGVSVEDLVDGSPVVAFDSFTYAMHGHSGNLTEDDKDILLRMAQQLADAHGKKDADGGTN